MQKKLTILTVIILGLLLVNGYFLFASPSDPQRGGPVFNTTQAFIAPQTQANYLPILDTTVGEVKLDARSAILYDTASGRNLFEKNISQQQAIASLTKVLTAIVVWEHLSPNDVVTIQPGAVKVDGERQNLYSGETMSVNNLIQLMLVESSNDAAYALRDYAQSKGIDLVSLMNQKAAELGMTRTKVMDPAGLDDHGYSTAEDLVKAVNYALRYNAIWNFSKEKEATVESSDGKIAHAIKTTNQLLGVLTGIVGGKTGYTDSALGCMILIVDVPNQNDKIIGIVLGSHSRFDDMKNLIDWARAAYRWK